MGKALEPRIRVTPVWGILLLAAIVIAFTRYDHQ